jgi:hypothetical protein
LFQAAADDGFAASLNYARADEWVHLPEFGIAHAVTFAFDVLRDRRFESLQGSADRQCSTTYVGAVETAEEFGLRIYTEAWNRGCDRATIRIIMGDGSPLDL